MNSNYLPPKTPMLHETFERLFNTGEGPNKKATLVTFQVTEDCCMACTYCYQLNKKPHKMTFEVAKKFIDDLLNDKNELINTSNTMSVCLDFIGGEPFMEIDLIEQIWEYYVKSMIDMKHPWLYLSYMSICSNGLLLHTEKVQNFLKKYAHVCNLSVSVDGNKDLHDSCRIDLQGKGTYDRIINEIHKYRNYFGIMPGTKMTLAPSNIKYVEAAVKNLIVEGYNDIFLNCIFEPGWTEEHATIFYYELKKIADYFIENHLYDKVSLSLFEENFFCPMSEEENTNWCGGVADQSIAIDYKGDMYPCIRYMDSSLNGEREPICLGNINKGYLKTEQDLNNYNKISNITRRSQSTDECFYCPIATGCAWCSAYNYQETGSVNKRVTHICIMHKARALANVYFWNKVYKDFGVNKIFKNNLPKDECLKIIPEEEYNLLQKLQEEN